MHKWFHVQLDQKILDGLWLRAYCPNINALAQVFFNSFFFGSRFLCVRSVHKPFFSSAHDQDINSLKVYKKGGCNIPNTIMYILVLPNPCIINYDSNIFPRSSQTCTLSKYWVKLAIFSSTVWKIQN